MNNKRAVTAVVVTMLVIIFLVESGMAMTCGQVDSSLIPCVSYLMRGGEPASQCCDGVRNIKQMTQTTEDKRTACECLKQAVVRFPTISPEAAAQLPQKCAVDVGVSITKDVDCSKIQ
ncbi:hypothetical protein K2173_019845 [Erythroxylum novogranatense]|uniref:Non-specific lipid-transfer protein n=1 Tax=Erythroxylum novogranatense TaxID=1862640 RepID=A0AAV8SMG3_9ROSI|nr:hypothetical protein K2173_019845 [Erythroxylum novogranatense]